MSNAQQAVADLREQLEGTAWRMPDAMDTWAFLVTEVAEVGDILLRLERPEYFRNNEKCENLEDELGDVMVMLATLANIYNLDLDGLCYRTCNKLLAKHGG